MSGLYGSLSVALSALSVSQQEMATTSNNVANANTPGYTREVPVYRRAIRSLRDR